ncbi:hypothetical protein HYX16_06785 [Candidatus Woesearchaeota archaeon]|nr:hypothetical protein [Candidatus Woesearchaeota archaeon]
MTELRRLLTEEEFRTLALDEKLEIFWSEEKNNFTSKDGDTVKVEAMHEPGTIVLAYKAIYKIFENGVYMEEKREFCYAAIRTKPNEFKYYCLGQLLISREILNNLVIYYIPVMFFKEVK